MRRFLSSGLALLALVVPGGAAGGSAADREAVDVYRSDFLTSQSLPRELRREAAAYLLALRSGRSARERALRVEDSIESAVRGLGDFAYVGVHVGRSVVDSELETTLTLDVVDRHDARARMPFLPVPKGSLTDPAGLLGQWRRYVGLGAALGSRGERLLERPACPGFYCPWVPRTDQVRALESRFAAEVPVRFAELQRVLAEDAEPRDRAAAVYLLSYVKSGEVVAGLMLKALRDPALDVRIAALCVLTDIAGYAPEVYFDVPPVLAALDYPDTAERIRALAVFSALSSDPDYHAYIANRAAHQLVRLLRARDPQVHDLAYTVLRVISGRDYDVQDYPDWEAWAKGTSAARVMPQPRQRGGRR